MNAPSPRALIAEDEPLLARALRLELASAWPELAIAATAGDGLSAAHEALARLPEVLFFDIRLPGQSGLAAAAEVFDAWPQDKALPLLVFTTAFDQYAVQAFEAQAVDYLLKPIQRSRLEKTVQKLRLTLSTQARAAINQEAALEQLRHLLALPGLSGQGTQAQPPRLTLLQVGIGQAVHMVPVADVVYFEAADKYVRVLTATQEHLIRMSLKELAVQLDPSEFWQVHRATLVRASCIAAALRDESGRLFLQLRGRPERLAVSRLYAPLFRAM